MAFFECPLVVDCLAEELRDDGSIGVRGQRLVVHVSAEARQHDIRFVVLEAAFTGAVHALVWMTEVHPH